MASEDLLPPLPSWDFDCECGGDPPPIFHLPPPPKPPGIFGPLEGSQPDDCNDAWTCPALGGGIGDQYGHLDDAGRPEATPEVPVAVIIVSATMLGLFLVVAAVIFFSRLWRSYKASSKKANCDLDGADIYEDMPAAPPLLPNPHHQPLHCSPRYKEDVMPPPRGGLPPTPALHLYSPEPRPDTPSDHLYHHISSGSETCSCSTSEAPSNPFLPTSLHLIHSEEDEASSSSRSSHSYNSSSTATPTSASPTPVALAHHCPPPSALYLCPPGVAGPPASLIPAYARGLHYAGGRYKHPSGGHPTSFPQPVYAINHSRDGRQHLKLQASPPHDNMVPLAQIYSPGSHLYESATLIRPNANAAPNCSMVHWGNVPTQFVQAVNSQQTMKPGDTYDTRHPVMVPLHNTMVHPLQYDGQHGVTSHTCLAQQHLGQMSTLDPSLYHHLNTHAHHLHNRHNHHHHHQKHPTHLPLPLHSSTLNSNSKLARSMHDVARSPEDITPTNSIPIDSIYDVGPHSDVDLIATTCLSTVSSIPNQNEYSTTIDAINISGSQTMSGHMPHLEESLIASGISDTSSSSHPSSTNEGVTVTESSSLESSGTTSSTIPLTNPLGNQRKDLPPLPSRADRYRIYAHNAEANMGGRTSSCRRSGNNNYSVSSANSSVDDTNNSRTAKSCDNLHNISPVDNPRLQLGRDESPAEASNLANNNYPYGGGATTIFVPSKKRNSVSDLDGGTDRPHLSGEQFGRHAYSNRRPPKRALRVPVDDKEEDVLYDNCSDT